MSARIEFSELVGAAGTLREACERAAVAAESDVVVFLLGERGVGKETLARALASASSSEPLIPLRATLTSKDRWKALLAGPREFSGRVLYISEAEAIPGGVGRDLIRALTAGSLGFRAIFGATTSGSPGEPRLASVELRGAMEAFPIAIPPLRERMEDFDAFVERFFHDACERYCVWRDPLSAEETKRLREITWRDNWDGLRRVLDFVVEKDVFPETDATLSALVEENVEPPLGDIRKTTEPDSTSMDNVESDSQERFPTLDEVAREHMKRALTKSHGAVEGKNGAAALLDVNPYTLRARMRKLGVDWTKFRDVQD